MAKIALILIAVFLCVQISVCIREKRRADEPETATETDLMDAIKSGIEKTFTEENFNKGVNFVTDLFSKARNASDSAIEKGRQAYNDWQAKQSEQTQA